MTPMNSENDDLMSYFIPMEDVIKKNAEKKTTIEGVDRRAARYLERGRETALGLPGDIIQLIRGLASNAPGGLAQEENQNFIQKAGRSLLESLPGSAELRARTAEERPQLEPQNEIEEVEDEFVQDVTSLVIPVGGKIPFARSIGIALAGNLGKQTVKEMGVDAVGQDLTKMGLMLFSGMFGKGRGINKYINNLYDEANAFVPQGEKFIYNTKNLDKLESQMKLGKLDDSKKPIVDFIEDLRAKMSNGQMTVEEATVFDKDINRAIGEAYKDASLRGNLKQLKKAHMNSLDNYAKQNPAWGEKWNEAKQAYQGIATAADIKNFVKRNANVKNFAHAMTLMGMEEFAFPGHAVAKMLGVGGVAATMYAGEVAKRIATNPALKKYYQNVIQASLSENKAMLIRNLEGLERASKKEFEKNPFPIFNLDEE